MDGWTAAVGHYQAGRESEVNFENAIRSLPADLSGQTGLLIASGNPSARVFTYIYKKITGLRPRTGYRLTTELTLASQAGQNCAGIGSPPYSNISAGGAAFQPQNFTSSNEVKINFLDNAFPAVIPAPTSMSKIGDTLLPSTGCANFRSKTLSSANVGNVEPVFATDADGSAWVIVGSTTGFEGRLSLYYLKGQMTLTPAS